MVFYNLNGVMRRQSVLLSASPRIGPTTQPRVVQNSCRSNLRHASSSQAVKSTCLFKFHQKRQAKMEPFAGYMMPINYKDQSIKSEHLQTRTSASVFDVSHMMQTIVSGKDRIKFIEALTVADVEGMGLNRSTLSVFTNESGGIIDDCIISKRKDDLYIVSNAGNAEIVWLWLNKNLSNNLNVKLERLVDQGLIALQGPRAASILQSLINVNLTDLEFMNTTEASIVGIGTCQVTRCGYTGEDGFEISVDPRSAETLMDLLCNKSEVKPAGLGARDTLRLEAGLCLHGHDITNKTTPVEAALSWTVHKRRRNNGGFLGSDTILRELRDGSKLKRVGLRAVGVGPPAREGCKVLDPEGRTTLGAITSGTFAPKLEKNIAMAYLPTSLANKFDHRVLCNVRGKNYEYLVTKMPFIKSNYYLKGKQ